MQRLRARFLRRSSTASSAKSLPKTPYGDPSRGQSEATLPSTGLEDARGRHMLEKSVLVKNSSHSRSASSSRPRQLLEGSPERSVANTPSIEANHAPLSTPDPTPSEPTPDQESVGEPLCPTVTLEAPTPEGGSRRQTEVEIRPPPERIVESIPEEETDLLAEFGPASAPLYTPAQGRPSLQQRRQSLVHLSQQRLITTLLKSERTGPHSQKGDYFTSPVPTVDATMINRKIWVKRPGASATLVSIAEDSLVDDVRDMILRKYANSLGRNFDAPDVTLRIVSRVEHSSRQPAAERVLGPEEPIGRTLDSYYIGGQTVDEALVIDVPQRRTPRPSPRYPHPMPYYMAEDLRPGEGSDYFPPMPPGQSPHVGAGSVGPGPPGAHHPSHPSIHSMSVLTTGQLPPLPSPGSLASAKASRSHAHRPRYGRQHTSSPTTVISAPGNPSAMSDHSSHPMNGAAPPPAPPLPTPPAAVEDHKPSGTPPLRSESPRPGTKMRKGKRLNPNRSNAAATSKNALPAGLLDGSVPPINVLIVEDNVINMRLLEAFMKRLKVRWQTAMDGRQAVTKWRAGGFHLVLMDIQLPVMNGLEATKEIRRLERLNNIGVFSNIIAESEDGTTPTSQWSPISPREKRESHAEPRYEPMGDDKLDNLSHFKSPVIIVALTASSLQSDRHEALAVGCNDFLTKPVNFVWLERKVTEWGCMQALIDFDGWRKWKDFAASTESSKMSLKGAQKEDSTASSKKSSVSTVDGIGPLVNSKAKKGHSKRRGSSDFNNTDSLKEGSAT